MEWKERFDGPVKRISWVHGDSVVGLVNPRSCGWASSTPELGTLHSRILYNGIPNHKWK